MGLLRVILNGMQDLNALLWLIPERTDIFVRSALQNHVTTSWTIRQQMDLFAAYPVSAHMVHQQLQPCCLSAWQPLLWLPLIMQHRERLWLHCANWKFLIHQWQNVIFSDGSLFCMRYSDGCVRVWRLQGDHTWSACIWYRHRDPAPSVTIWAAIGYTACTFLVPMDGSLNADWYISYIIHSVFVLYYRGLPNAIIQKDNAKPRVACCVLSFINTQGIWLLQ